MPSTHDPMAVTTDVDPLVLRDALRYALVIGVLLVAGALVSVLPGAARQIPGTGVPIGAALSTTVALAAFVTLLEATPAVGAVVRACVDGPADLVDDLAAAARYGVVFAAVLLAYAGFAPTVLPVIGADSAWIYDVAFLGFALVPAVAIARRLYRSADPIAGYLARQVADSAGSSETASGSSRS